MENSSLTSLISCLENLRTLVVYDSIYACNTLFFSHIVPFFSSKNLYIAVYSESMCRRLRKMYNSLLKVNPDITRVLNKANVIKIGCRNNIPFGRFYEFIPEDDWYKKLVEIVDGLGEDDLLILHGFSLIPALGSKRDLLNYIKVLDTLHDDVTVIGRFVRDLYSQDITRLIERYYDVTIDIKKDEIGCDECYVLSINQSLIVDIKPRTIGRFKIWDYRFVEYQL